MGTLLSFHNRNIYRPNRLLIASLTALLILNNLHQTLCVPVPLMNGDSSRRIRHLERKMPSLPSDQQTGSNNTDSYFGIFSIKSPCSDNYVTIYNEKIMADSTIPATIEFEKISGTSDQFYIKRARARKYVCVSRRGKLVVSEKPTADHRCAFTQVSTQPTSLLQSDNRSIEIRSVAHHSWYIGFRTNGRPMRAWKYKYMQDKKCFQLQIQKGNRNELSTSSIHRRRHADSRSLELL